MIERVGQTTQPSLSLVSTLRGQVQATYSKRLLNQALDLTALASDGLLVSTK